MDKGADVNARTKSGETPLMLAAAGNQPEGNQPEVVRLLLDKKADVNARDDEGRTPLMFAAENGRLENAKLLLSEGADVRRKDKHGRTALDLVKPAEQLPDVDGGVDEAGPRGDPGQGGEGGGGAAATAGAGRRQGIVHRSCRRTAGVSRLV